MKHKKEAGQFLVIVMVILAASLIISAQQQQQPSSQTMQRPDEHNASTCPMMEERKDSQDSSVDHTGHADAMAEMNMRGEREMGFSQERTTHHFRLMNDGGAIEVEVNDPVDVALRDNIRRHLARIARAFSEGDFSTPFAIHASVPPGVPVMKRLQAAINYKFEETERGGRVRISTSDSQALTAIHAFLSFQIREHRTGDPLEEEAK